MVMMMMEIRGRPWMGVRDNSVLKLLFALACICFCDITVYGVRRPGVGIGLLVDG